MTAGKAKAKGKGGARRQGGGFAVGLLVGLLLGLALAVGVALYVNKVPVPFVDKLHNRTAEQDAAEMERNKNWDPNAPLVGKPQPMPPRAAPGAVAPPVATGSAPSAQQPGMPMLPPPVANTPARDPAAILSGQATAPQASAPASAPRVASARPGVDPFNYFVQVGAYGRPEDAEQQRARLGLIGMAAKVTEREQAGRTVYRVRLGPFERKDDADAAQERLQANAIESALVRVER